ncbi:10565_t:CDS:1, partial [Gigaspora rosea]
NETPESIEKRLERKPKKQRQLSTSIIKKSINKKRQVKRTKSLPSTYKLKNTESEDLETFFIIMLKKLFFK